MKEEEVWAQERLALKTSLEEMRLQAPQYAAMFSVLPLVSNLSTSEVASLHLSTPLRPIFLMA